MSKDSVILRIDNVSQVVLDAFQNTSNFNAVIINLCNKIATLMGAIREFPAASIIKTDIVQRLQTAILILQQGAVLGFPNSFAQLSAVLQILQVVFIKVESRF